MDLGQIALFVVGAIIFGATVWLVRGRDLTGVKTQRDTAQRELDLAQNELSVLRKTAADAREEAAAVGGKLEIVQASAAELENARARINELVSENRGLSTKLEAAEKRYDEQKESLIHLREEMQNQFKIVASEVLKVSSDDFLKRATEEFVSQKELTKIELDQRAEAISKIVQPLGESLKSYEKLVTEIEKARNESYGGIREALTAVNVQQSEVKTVTANLVNALKASPKTRGRWGEETLRRVVELSGMVEHCDFETEKHFRTQDEALRPDMLISVAGSRSIVVDAKAPVSAYIDAISATSDEERELLLNRHASQLRKRLVDLSSKSYWEHFQGSVDCVVMFVPGDNFVSAAFERDPDLFEDGIKSRVLICTPTTFIALAKAISYGWRQERLAQSALEIGKLGKELYGRLSSFGDHVMDLGSLIERSVKKYNLMVGSLENSVMPQARRFNELGVEGTSEPIQELVEVDTIPRLPELGRDLVFTKRDD